MADQSTSLWTEDYASFVTTSGVNNSLAQCKEDANSNVTTKQETYIDHLIWTYCSPPIFVLGIVGNILTILVTSQRPTRSTSSGVYLLGMSLAAIGVYLAGFLTQWLRSCGFIDLNELSDWSCRFNKFFYYSWGDVAIWSLTLLTFDRLVAVSFPLRKVHVCTRRRAVMFTWIVAGLVVVKNFHLFWTRGTVYDPCTKQVKTHCGQPEPYTHFEKFVRPHIVFVTVNLIPVIIILVCNVVIVRTLARGRRIRRSVGSTGKKPRTRMTTMMCLVASFSFIIFMTPSIILVVLQPYYPGEPYNIAKAINNLLVYVNYATNFFLYCLAGRSFRFRLKVLLQRICCRSKTAHFQLHPFFAYSQRIATAAAAVEFVGSGSTKTSASGASSSSTTESANIQSKYFGPV